MIGDLFKQLIGSFQAGSRASEKPTTAALSPERLKATVELSMRSGANDAYNAPPRAALLPLSVTLVSNVSAGVLALPAIDKPPPTVLAKASVMVTSRKVSAPVALIEP